MRDRAVRMVGEIAGQHESEWAAMGEVARLLGVGTPETVRKWVRQAEVDGGRRPGTTSEESAELKRLRRENAELKRANAILKAASTFFASMPSSGVPGRVRSFLCCPVLLVAGRPLCGLGRVSAGPPVSGLIGACRASLTC